MKILVIAAHPDDEVLGCGGTIARHAQEGHDVHVLILGEGMTSRFDDRSKAPAADLTRLHDQAQRAGSLLGVKKVVVRDAPDNRFDTVPLLDIVKRIEEQIDAIQPEIVYTQHGGDLNIDHERTFRATITATRPLAGTTVKKVYAYEVPSSTEWSFKKFEPVFRPTTFVDISATLEMKIRAMAIYETESRVFPHPRSPEALRARAAYWGSTAGLKAAEAFELVRDVQ